MDVAEFEAAGLYDPRAPAAADRLALLRWLASRGITIEQMVHAARERGLTLTGLAGDLALRPGRRMTLAELAAEMGVDPARIDAIRHASGLQPRAPDERAYTSDDAASFRSFMLGAAQFGETSARRFARVVGAAMASIAEAAFSMFMVSIEEPIREARGGELALAQANLRAIESIGLIPTSVEGVFRAHVETATRRLRTARSTPSVDTARLAVSFVDLVGFTTLSRRISTRELAELVERFEETAHEVATARDGRVVKLIGDEVMFVTVRAAAACDIALALVERFSGDASITPRGGLALGALLLRGGDYYGPVVNLAARLAELAVPGELLVTPEVAADAAAGGLRFPPAGRRMLKGFDEPVTLFTVERS